MGRKSASGSGMNNPDHIFFCLETIFFIFRGVKILKFFDADPGWRQFGSGIEKSRIRDKHPGSAALGSASLKMRIRIQLFTAFHFNADLDPAIHFNAD
jgi:hypothetical protein